MNRTYNMRKITNSNKKLYCLKTTLLYWCISLELYTAVGRGVRTGQKFREKRIISGSVVALNFFFCQNIQFANPQNLTIGGCWRCPLKVFRERKIRKIWMKPQHPQVLSKWEQHSQLFQLIFSLFAD